jgi:hypothetical protein
MAVLFRVTLCNQRTRNITATGATKRAKRKANNINIFSNSLPSNLATSRFRAFSCLRSGQRQSTAHSHLASAPLIL